MPASKRKAQSSGDGAKAVKKPRQVYKNGSNSDNCRFSVALIPRPKASTKKRQSGGKAKDATASSDVREEQFSFMAGEPMAYVVQPVNDWTQMKSYKHFQLTDRKFTIGDFVLVNNGNIPLGESADEEDAFYPARILEIRAADASNVYARVFWLYWPSDLVAHGGRQHYHGNYELIASNYMDVVDVTTISDSFSMTRFIESDDNLPPLNDWFWRQTYEPWVSKNGKLSPLERGCTCRTYRAPVRAIVRCRNSECGQWLHEDCIAKHIERSITDPQGPTAGVDDSSDGSDAGSTDPKTNDPKEKLANGAEVAETKAKPAAEKGSRRKPVKALILHEQAEPDGPAKITGKVVVEDSRSGTLERTERQLQCTLCGSDIGPK